MSSGEAKSLAWDKIMLPPLGEPQCQLLPTTASWQYCAKLKEQKDISILSTILLMSHKTYTCYKGTSHSHRSTMCPSKNCPQRVILSNDFLCSTSITRNLTSVASKNTGFSFWCNFLCCAFYYYHDHWQQFKSRMLFLVWGSILHI